MGATFLAWSEWHKCASAPVSFGHISSYQNGSHQTPQTVSDTYLIEDSIIFGRWALAVIIYSLICERQQTTLRALM